MPKAPYDVKTAQQLLSKNLISPKQFASIKKYADGTPEVMADESAMIPQGPADYMPPPAPVVPQQSPMVTEALEAPKEGQPEDPSLAMRIAKGLGSTARGAVDTGRAAADNTKSAVSKIYDMADQRAAERSNQIKDIVGAIHEGYTGEKYDPSAPSMHQESIKPANMAGADFSQAPWIKNVSQPNIEMETPQQAKARAEAEMAQKGPNYLDKYQDDMNKYFNMQAEAIQKSGQGNGGAREQANLLMRIKKEDLERQQANDRNEIDRQADLAKAKDEYDGYINKVAGMKVDPKRFWGNQSTGDKIAAGIGLVFGAFGSRGNQAVTVMTDAIDKDIQAQKADIATQKDVMTSKGNLYNDMRNQFKDERSAELATKSAMLQNSMLEVQATAARYSGGDSAGKAQIALAQLGMQKAQVDMQFMQQREKMDMMKKLGYDPMDEKQRERFVPEYGLITSGTPKEAEEFRNMVAEKNSTVQQIDELKRLSEIPFGSVTPAVKARALAITTQLSGQLVKPLLGVNRTTENEIELVKEALGESVSATSWGPSVKARLDTIKEALDNSVGSRAQVLGLRNNVQKFEGGLGITKGH